MATAITVPAKTVTQQIQRTRNNLRESGSEISLNETVTLYKQAETIIDIMLSEMIGSKNKYVIDFLNQNGDNE